MPKNRSEPWNLYWCSDATVDRKQWPPSLEGFDWFVLADTPEDAQLFIAKYEIKKVDDVETKLLRELTPTAQAEMDNSGVEPDSDDCFGYPSLLILKLAGGDIVKGMPSPRVVDFGRYGGRLFEGPRPSAKRAAQEAELEAAYQSRRT